MTFVDELLLLLHPPLLLRTQVSFWHLRIVLWCGDDVFIKGTGGIVQPLQVREVLLFSLQGANFDLLRQRIQSVLIRLTEERLMMLLPTRAEYQLTFVLSKCRDGAEYPWNSGRRRT